MFFKRSTDLFTIDYLLHYIDAGILLSNSVVQAMKANLDWCINNAISDDNSENLGRCIHHSINLECQEEIQVDFNKISNNSYR